jgi:hypothetical protein
LYKALAWVEVTQDSRILPKIVDIFGFSKIELEQIYPSLDLGIEHGQSTQSLVLYDFTPPTVSKSTPTYIPVTILDPVTKKKAFGLLIITVYESTE